MLAVDRSKYLNFVLTDLRYCGGNSFYTATDALLTLEAEVVKQEEPTAERKERTQKQLERLPVLEMLRKYGLEEQREHLLLAGKPGSGKSTTLRRLCVELAEIALADDRHPIPVFVQLKGDKSILTLIQAEFRRAKLKVTAEQIDDLLLADKLVLLLDGVNEIPSEQLRRELQDFRENNLTTPTIFTTRDLTIGGSLGIDKRLEMRPLTDEQMRDFVRKYLPEYGDKLLGQLRDRLREIAETPLLLKMLCEVFEPATGRIPQNKAELFELFDRKYQSHKDAVAISDDFLEGFQSETLQYLAFTMLQGDAQKPTEAWLTLSRQRAERMLEVWLKQRGETDPASKAKKWLKDLLKHHLLQVAADPQQIEFHHQLFQEYYAAQHLQSMLQDKHPDLVDDDRLKHFYLNYLKWTEPLGLLLGLLDDESQALRLVGLGLEVDWFLGARLAGEVKQGFQQQTVELVNQLIVEKDLPQWLKFELWEKTRSSAVVSDLFILLKDSNFAVQLMALDAIVKLSNIADLLPLLQHPDSFIRWRVTQAIVKLGDKNNVVDLLPLLQHSESDIRLMAVDAIFKLGDKSNIADLLPLLQHSEPDVLRRVVDAISHLGDKSNIADLLPLLQHSEPDVLRRVVDAISHLGDKSNIADLLPLLQHSESDIRWRVVDAISHLGDKSNITDLLPLLQHSEPDVLRRVVDAISHLGDKSNIADLLPLLQHSESDVLWRVEAAIDKLGDKSNVTKLLPLLQHSDSIIRWGAVETIIQQGDKRDIADILPLLQHSDSDILHSVKYAISELRDKSNIAELLPFLHHPNFNVRYKMVEVIVKLGDKNNIVDLLPFLQNKIYYTQRSAALAISQLGDKSNIPDLLRLLQDSNSNTRHSAVEEIVRVGNKSNIPDLLRLLHKSISRQYRHKYHISKIQSAIIEATVRLGDKSNIPDLIPLLQNYYLKDFSKDRNRQALVVEAIIRLGDESNIPDLLPLLQDCNSIVRKNAVKMIERLGDMTILPDLRRKLTKSVHKEIAELIDNIQAKCEFYDYDIYHSSPHSIHPSQTGLTVYGDYVAGDKTQGDKITGNKTENNFPNAIEVKIFENVTQYDENPPPS